MDAYCLGCLFPDNPIWLCRNLTSDKRENRKRTYEVTDLLDQIRSGKYHPPLVLSLKDGLYVIDGRTRLYAALALDIDPKIKIITKDNFE